MEDPLQPLLKHEESAPPPPMAGGGLLLHDPAPPPPIGEFLLHDPAPSTDPDCFCVTNPTLFWLNNRPYSILGVLGEGGFGVV